MNAIVLKEKLRNSERKMLYSGLFFSIIILLTWLFSGTLYLGFIAGYFIGTGSYISLIEISNLLTGKSPKLSIGLLIFANIKLILIGGIVYWLHVMGFSLLQIAFGIFTSQLSVSIIALRMYQPSKHKSAEISEVSKAQKDKEKELESNLVKDETQ